MSTTAGPQQQQHRVLNKRDTSNSRDANNKESPKIAGTPGRERKMGKMIHEKDQERKISWHCPCKWWVVKLRHAHSRIKTIRGPLQDDLALVYIS
jgi:hypothetical protein